MVSEYFSLWRLRGRPTNLFPLQAQPYFSVLNLKRESQARITILTNYGALKGLKMENRTRLCLDERGIDLPKIFVCAPPQILPRERVFPHAKGFPLPRGRQTFYINVLRLILLSERSSRESQEIHSLPTAYAILGRSAKGLLHIRIQGGAHPSCIQVGQVSSVCG